MDVDSTKLMKALRSKLEYMWQIRSLVYVGFKSAIWLDADLFKIL